MHMKIVNNVPTNLKSFDIYLDQLYNIKNLIILEPMKTLKLRIRDKHTEQSLNRLSGSVNFVWNYVNDLSYRHLQKLANSLVLMTQTNYTKGGWSYFVLHSQTIQAINETYQIRVANSKKQTNCHEPTNPKSKRKNLGWLSQNNQAKHIKTGKRA